MTAKVPFFLLLALAATSSVACSEQSAADASGPGDVDASDGATSIVLRPAAGFKVKPLEKRSVTAAVTPPGVYAVRFALLTGADQEGPADAALDQTLVESDEKGIAEVELTAPSGPTVFSIRGSINAELFASFDVVVVANGVATLEVSPVYSGDRPHSEWVADVYPDATCDDFAGAIPDQEPARTATDPSSPIVTEVPVGPELAVIARAGHFIAGCTSVTNLAEGQQNRVFVSTNNLPIQLGENDLSVSLNFETASDPWLNVLDERIEQTELAMLGNADNDVESLLDALGELVPNAYQDDVATLRESGSWDQSIAALLGSDYETAVRSAAHTWLTRGSAILLADTAIEGFLRPVPDDVTAAEFEFGSIAGFSPEAVGFPDSAPTTWSADSQDTMLFTAAAEVSVSRWLGGLAEDAATTNTPAWKGVPQAISSAIGCNAIASTLLDNSGPDHVLYPSCALSCAVSLCTGAVSALWTQAIQSSEPEAFELSASGKAGVGDASEVTSLAGSWVGRLSSESDEATCGGSMSAATEPQ